MFWSLFYMILYSYAIYLVGYYLSGWLWTCGYFRINGWIFTFIFWFYFNKIWRKLFRRFTRWHFKSWWYMSQGYYCYSMVYIIKCVWLIYFIYNPKWAIFYFFAYFYILFWIYHWSYMYVVYFYYTIPKNLIVREWSEALLDTKLRILKHTSTIPYPFNYFGYDVYDPSSFVFQLTMI